MNTHVSDDKEYQLSENDTETNLENTWEAHEDIPNLQDITVNKIHFIHKKPLDKSAKQRQRRRKMNHFSNQQRNQRWLQKRRNR